MHFKTRAASAARAGSILRKEERRMKKNYEALEMEIIRFENQDIITASGNEDGDIDKFEEDEGLEDF